MLLNLFDESEKYAASENKSLDFEQISEASSLIATTSTVKNAATVIGSTCCNYWGTSCCSLNELKR